MACERRQRDFDSFSTEKRMKKECLIAVFNFIMSVFLGGKIESKQATEEKIQIRLQGYSPP